MPKKQNKTEGKMQLTVDYAFKRVFGKNGNESILKDLLESILNIEIKSITIQNPEIPKNIKDGKVGVLDVRAELNGDEITEVEMQVQDQHNIDKRSPTYLTKIYSDQLKEGEQYIEVKKVVVINILNFDYYKRNSYHSVARMMFEESKENEKVDLGYIVEDKYATKDLEMHFIELPKFRKKDPDMSNKLEQWLCLICNEEDKIKMAESKNEEIEKAKKELEKLAMNPEDRELYELRLKAIRDEMNIRYSGYIDGMAEGEAKGRAEGKNERNIEIAKNMLKENVNIQFISKMTGLNLEEIEKLK
jgi:predicted transposase/invertase (TIGR01784 family)